MTEETESRIPLSDIARVAVLCKSCQAEVTMDLSNERHAQKLVDPASLALRCPVCTTEFDSLLRLSLAALWQWRDQAGRSGHEVYFRVKR